MSYYDLIFSIILCPHNLILILNIINYHNLLAKFKIKDENFWQRNKFNLFVNLFFVFFGGVLIILKEGSLIILLCVPELFLFILFFRCRVAIFIF